MAGHASRNPVNVGLRALQIVLVPRGTDMALRVQRVAALQQQIVLGLSRIQMSPLDGVRVIGSGSSGKPAFRIVRSAGKVPADSGGAADGFELTLGDQYASF